MATQFHAGDKDRGTRAVTGITVPAESASLLLRAFDLVSEWRRRNPEVSLPPDTILDFVHRIVNEWPRHRLMSERCRG